MKTLLSFFILFSILQSCNHDYKIPHISEGIIYLGPTGKENLFRNNISDTTLKGIKKITQIYSDTILNILEFDTKGRVIFKYAKSYMHEYWNGKYVTYITANFYENEFLRKTYHLYSNVGFNIIEFSNFNSKGEALRADVKEHSGVKNDNINSNILDSVATVGEGSINSNIYRAIDTILSFNQLLKFSKIKEMERLKKFTCVINRKYKFFTNEVVDEYDFLNSLKDDYNVVFKFDKNGNLVQCQNEYWKYDNQSRMVETSYVSKNDTSLKHIYKYGKTFLPDKIIVGEVQYLKTYKNLKLVSEQEYKGNLFMRSNDYVYNTLGLIIEERIREFENSSLKKYQYELEYY